MVVTNYRMKGRAGRSGRRREEEVVNSVIKVEKEGGAVSCLRQGGGRVVEGEDGV